MKISVEILNINDASKQDRAVVEINADEEGLDYLIKLLSDLKKNGDHFHLMTPAWGMNDLTEEKLHEKSVLVNHLEIIRNEGAAISDAVSQLPDMVQPKPMIDPERD